MSASTCEYKAQPIERSFETVLSFAQELINVNGTFVPRPINTAPLTPVIGRLLLRFSRDLSVVKFRLSVFGNANPLSINQLVTVATLNAGRSSENGPIIAVLFNNPTGIRVNGLLASGILTNANIRHVTSASGNTYNTVASLLQGIRKGDVYVNILGSNRDPNTPGFANGLIRGQIFARQTD